jgi:hypothetical protein
MKTDDLIQRAEDEGRKTDGYGSSGKFSHTA